MCSNTNGWRETASKQIDKGPPGGITIQTTDEQEKKTTTSLVKLLLTWQEI